MVRPFISRVGPLLLAALAVVLMLLRPGFAELSQREIDGLSANPRLALQQHGPQLVSTIRDLVLANPNVLPVIIALLASADAGQLAPIGAGLGQAALASVQSNPNLANRIPSALAASGNQAAIVSYSSVTGNIPTTASAPAANGDNRSSNIFAPLTATAPSGGSGSAPAGGASQKSTDRP